MFSNLRLVLRSLRQSPGFTATTVLMLAFGIGATTAIFSMVDGILLRPLPFPHPDRLVVLGDRFGEGGEGAPGSVAPRDVVVYTRDTRAFEGVGGYAEETVELAGTGDPVRISIARMTTGVFRALGVAPQRGRVFTDEEDANKDAVAVLSFTAWKVRFGGDPAILGRTVLLNRIPYEIIGVMPRAFEFPLEPGRGNQVELWVPMSFTDEELAPESDATWAFQMVGRLKPGVSLLQASKDAETVASELRRGFPAQYAHFHLHADIAPLMTMTVGGSRPMLRILLIAVGFVLLLACANLAGLLLVRAIRRQREMAVRLALGASGWNLVQTSLLESLVIALSGGLLGVGLAALALRVALRFVPPVLPRMDNITMNATVVVFAFVLALLTGLLCGLVPALAILRMNVLALLKDGGRSGSTGTGQARVRSALVVLEIALALVLMTGSGLLLRSWMKMNQVDPGFLPEHVATGWYSLPQKEYGTQVRIDTFNQELLRRLRSLPGVTAVGWTSTLPAANYFSQEGFVPEGAWSQEGAAMEMAAPVLVEGEYFRAAGLRLLKGRFFTASDDGGGELVTIVNRALADRFWPKQNPIGRRIRLGTESMRTPWMTVVGEIDNAPLGPRDQSIALQFYQPVLQLEKSYGPYGSSKDLNGTEGYIVLRSALPAAAMEQALRETVHSLDPQLPLSQVRTLEDVVAASGAPRRFNMVVISGFAVVAVLLAILGIYAVIAFSVASRREEMAIRIALGADRGRIMGLVFRSGLTLATLGCAFGLTGEVLAARMLRSYLFDVSPFDPVVLTLVAAAVFALALLASAWPARRAASVDPIRVFRGL